jgi:hypothetical protein
MAAPIPKWLNPDGTQRLQWDAGIVDAGTTSAEVEVYIWNNKGTSSASPSTDVADMTNVFVTTKNTDGSDTGPVATKTDAIVEVATFDGATWSSWSEVGGSASTVQLVNAAGEVATIRGTGNDGNSLTTATKKNYARLKMRLKVLDTAPAGPISWKTRVSYQYTA